MLGGLEEEPLEEDPPHAAVSSAANAPETTSIDRKTPRLVLTWLRGITSHSSATPAAISDYKIVSRPNRSSYSAALTL